MRHWGRIIFPTAAVLLLMFCTSAGESQAPAGSALPALELLRSTSGSSAAQQDGSDALKMSGNAVVDGSELAFGDLESSTLEWGIWCFSLPDPLLSAAVSCLAPSGGLYIAVADYSTGRWDMRGPFTGSRVIQLDDIANRSTAGDLYLAVLATLPGSSVQGISVSTDTGGGGEGQYFDESLGVDMGEFVDLAIVNGHPAIACFDATNMQLMYCRANDASGSSWGTPVYADTAAMCGYNPSLAVIAGRPAIAYESFENSVLDLKYVRAADDDGNTWGTPTTLIFAVSLAYFPVLREVDGGPAVACVNTLPTPAQLQYMRANDATGASWPTATTISSDAAPAVFDMEIVNGSPAIGWLDSDNALLSFMRATDAQGGSWGSPVSVDAAVAGGYEASLAIVDGNPAIAYSAGDVTELRYVRATDGDGTAWATPLTLDSGTDTGAFCSLAVTEGLPAVAYFHGDFIDELKFVRATDAAGSGWDSPLVLDADSGYGTALAEVNGKSALAYFAIGRGLVGWLYDFLDP